MLQNNTHAFFSEKGFTLFTYSEIVLLLCMFVHGVALTCLSEDDFTELVSPYLNMGSGDPNQVKIIRHYQASQISLGWRGVGKGAQTLCKIPPSLPSLLVKLLKYAISL